MDVGITERIAKLRILKGMSYAQFGAEIGRSKTAIYYAETGERNATPDLLRRIINVFCVNEEWLLKGTGEIFDDAAIRKKKIYDIAFSKLEKVADSCKQLEGSLYFVKRHGDDIVPEFKFYEYFSGLDEEKVRNSPVEPLELIRAFLNYYVQMDRLISQALQMIEKLKDFYSGQDFKLIGIKRSLETSQKRFDANVSYFKEYVRANNSSAKMLGILDEIVMLCKTLDYRQQIDIKNWLQEKLAH